MNCYKDQKDDVLVELSLLGNTQAYEELVIRYEKAVKGTALKVTENLYSAEDASQDAFVSAWIKLDSLRDPHKFGSWVCSIAKNCARNLVIHYKNTAADISLNLLEDQDPEQDAHRLLLEQERDANLREAVSTLSEKIRIAIQLHYFQGLSVEEIALQQNIPIGTVKWRLNEGRKQLRKEYGIMTKMDENRTFVQKVMYQVEQLKLWAFKSDKSGFEKEYRTVLKNVEQLEDSIDKHHALADVLLRGYWWLPGEKNDATFTRIKESAQKSRNEEVLQSVVSYEMNKLKDQDVISFLRDVQIPYLEENGLTKTLGFCWFWLSYYYIAEKRFEEGVAAYNKTLEILDESNIYYANALSAIEVEQKILMLTEAEQRNMGMHANAESFKRVNGKMYFWQQPGYARGNGNNLGCDVFWNCSGCDRLMPDEHMLLQEKFHSSDGNVTMYCKAKDLVTETPAGNFKDCLCFVWEMKKPLAGFLYSCESYFCPGIGIVRQVVQTGRGTQTLDLKDHVTQGEGILPFVKGNRWDYTSQEEGILYDRQISFEVVSATEDTVILKSYSLLITLGYDHSAWCGNMLKARNEYHADDHTLQNVLDCYEHAGLLAKTNREKRHTTIAKNVMERILTTDPGFNPNYTEKGRWNFFNFCHVKKTGEKTSLSENRLYGFEWKDMKNSGDEGYKVLYNSPYAILNQCMGAIWSEAWTPGYHVKQKSADEWWGDTENVFDVLEDEDITLPIGTFKNCRHIRHTTTGFAGGMGYYNGTKDYWFALGIGMVKFSSTYKNDTLQTIWVLTDYQGTGNGYFPTEDGLVRKYEPTELGNGWHGAVEYTFDTDETGTVLFRNGLGTQDRGNYEAAMKMK